MTNSEIMLWIGNDEGLYNWWRLSRQSKTAFIKENRADIVASIRRYLDKPPGRATPRTCHECLPGDNL